MRGRVHRRKHSCARTRARGMMRPMLEDPRIAASPNSDTVTISREDFERLRSQLKFAQTKIAALNFEVARLKRWRFGQSSESLDAQAPLFEAIVADTAIEEQAAREQTHPPKDRTSARRAVRQALPATLARIEHRHELDDPNCACGQPLLRIDEDVSEQLDCVPAQIYARSGVHLARSSMAQWVGICGVRLAPLADALREFILGHRVVHADETPVRLLAPGKGKTHRAYVWVYRTTDFVAQRAVWFDFCTGRGGEHPTRVLKAWRGTLVTDDYAGYNAIHARGDIVEAGCMAHARRKLFEAHELNASPIAGHAVALIGKLYEIEAEIKALDPEDRWRIRQQRAKPVAEQLHQWLADQRHKLV